MDQNKKRALINRYLHAYNAFDIDGMTEVLHPDVEFEHVEAGKTIIATTGLGEFRQLAERSRSVFKLREQSVLQYSQEGDKLVADVEFTGVPTRDLPGKGEQSKILRLKGRSEFAFSEGKICRIRDTLCEPKGGNRVANRITFSISPAYQARYPGVAFGLTLITGCGPVSDQQGYDQQRKKLLRKMRKRETLAEITTRIETYDRFFQSFGFECPLPKHLHRTVHSGFPQYNLMVDAHFMAEMCAGILVAVTDFDRIEGALTLDVAGAGETSLGMGGRLFTTKKGEIVLRDERDIVCVLCQGADEKTRVKEDSRNILFYAYAVPGIDAGYLDEGLTVAAETMERFGGGTIQGKEIHTGKEKT